ncbi:MAG: Peroxide-responsive repressor PerR [Syntrophorhabdus sp. PtaU1.Bin153]|nr:MAG: Peroxide-responsive repressor PerR [Syntrophorhabdus sp. PtaU1.Bin153]
MNGLKLTPQGRWSSRRLSRRGICVPVPVPHEEAKKKERSLSLFTTCMTLNVFSRLGIIKALQFDSQESRYEVNLEKHVNPICDGHGGIIDCKVPPFVDQQEIASKTGFSVTGNRLELWVLW